MAVILVFAVGFGMRHVMLQVGNSVDATTSSEVSPTAAAHKAFIKKMATPAVAAYHQTGQVLPSIVLAQGILESNWGTSELYLQANNPFGVKGTYQGQSKTFPTSEYVNGKKIQIQAAFRAYPSLETAILDHDALLANQYLKNQRITSFSRQAKLLQENGYATDPDYAEKLVNLINQYQLSQYDA
ncbi:glycoside hydrolase family 73 protein [Levilactobacillus bambusae]|nr:glucosaminidase domain-containing protein [Levilactobacillus bambusae]